MPRRLQAYPMILLLLPLVVAIVLFDRFYPKPQPPEEPQKYGFVVVGAPKATAKCERFETRELGMRELGIRELGIRETTRCGGSAIHNNLLSGFSNPQNFVKVKV